MSHKLLGVVIVLSASMLLPVNSMALGLRGKLPMLVALFASFQVTPSSLAFASTDPDSAGASSTGIARWSNLIGALPNSWTLSVSAAAAQPTNCPLVPLSAFRITCASITSVGINLPNYSCGSAMTLSATPQVLASGSDDAVVSAIAAHTVTFSITFTDSWKYPATVSSCSIPLTYTLDAH